MIHAERRAWLLKVGFPYGLRMESLGKLDMGTWINRSTGKRCFAGWLMDIDGFRGYFGHWDIDIKTERLVLSYDRLSEYFGLNLSDTMALFGPQPTCLDTRRGYLEQLVTEDYLRTRHVCWRK